MNRLSVAFLVVTGLALTAYFGATAWRLSETNDVGGHRQHHSTGASHRLAHQCSQAMIFMRDARDDTRCALPRAFLDGLFCLKNELTG